MVDESSILSDRFIDHQYDTRVLKKLFDKESWSCIKKKITHKINESLCPVCLEICFESSIQCFECAKWFHFNCAGKEKTLSHYAKSGKVKKWKCTKYGFKCEK